MGCHKGRPYSLALLAQVIPQPAPLRLINAPAAGPLPTGAGAVAEALDLRAANRRSLPTAYCLSVGGAYIVLHVRAIRVFCVPSGVLTLSVLDKSRNLD